MPRQTKTASTAPKPQASGTVTDSQDKKRRQGYAQRKKERVMLETLIARKDGPGLPEQRLIELQDVFRKNRRPQTGEVDAEYKRKRASGVAEMEAFLRQPPTGKAKVEDNESAAEAGESSKGLSTLQLQWQASNTDKVMLWAISTASAAEEILANMPPPRRPTPTLSMLETIRRQEAEEEFQDQAHRDIMRVYYANKPFPQ